MNESKRQESTGTWCFCSENNLGSQSEEFVHNEEENLSCNAFRLCSGVALTELRLSIAPRMCVCPRSLHFLETPSPHTPPILTHGVQPIEAQLSSDLDFWIVHVFHGIYVTVI